MKYLFKGWILSRMYCELKGYFSPWWFWKLGCFQRDSAFDITTFQWLLKCTLCHQHITAIIIRHKNVFSLWKVSSLHINLCAIFQWFTLLEGMKPQAWLVRYYLWIQFSSILANLWKCQEHTQSRWATRAVIAFLSYRLLLLAHGSLEYLVTSCSHGVRPWKLRY